MDGAYIIFYELHSGSVTGQPGFLGYKAEDHLH